MDVKPNCIRTPSQVYKCDDTPLRLRPTKGNHTPLPVKHDSIYSDGTELWFRDNANQTFPYRHVQKVELLAFCCIPDCFLFAGDKSEKKRKKGEKDKDLDDEIPKKKKKKSQLPE